MSIYTTISNVMYTLRLTRIAKCSSIDGDADMVYTLLSRREVIEAISSSASVANRASPPPPGATPTM